MKPLVASFGTAQTLGVCNLGFFKEIAEISLELLGLLLELLLLLSLLLHVFMTEF